MPVRCPRRAFTLVEMLVVIAVVGVLIALLLPAIQAVRESARAATCRSNMRQIGIALQLYHDSFRRFPSGWTTKDPDDPEGAPGWGWAVWILPYMEQGDLFENKLNLKLAISDPLNKAGRETSITTFLCPVDPGGPTFELHAADESPLFELGRSNYVGVFGTEPVEHDPANGDATFFQNSAIGIRRMGDGTSTTIIVGERSSLDGASTWVGVVDGAEGAIARVVGSADHPPNFQGEEGGHEEGDEHDEPAHDHLDDFSSVHPGGAHFVFGDTAVRIISSDISAEVFRALATRDANDFVDAKSISE